MKRINEAETVVTIDAATSVSALLTMPQDASVCYVLAHGAGAGMGHWFLQEIAEGLALRRVATLRFQFPYMERRSKRPDGPAVAHAAVRAACALAAKATALPLIAGGRSFGGRMASQAQAIDAITGVLGLAFLGFPLHPAGTASKARADHLIDVQVPMLFVQGTRDKLAEPALMEEVIQSRRPFATMLAIAHADHGFGVTARSGRTHEEVMAQILDGAAAWMHDTADRPSRG